MVIILLRIFDISSQKKNGKEKSRFLLIINKKNVKKVYVNIEHSVNWVSTSLLKITTALFLASAPS